MRSNYQTKKQAGLTPSMKMNKAAVALSSIKPERKAKAARINGAKRGRPPKRHTLSAPCTFPGYKVTNGHEHLQT